MSTADLAAYAARNARRWGLNAAALFARNRDVPAKLFLLALRLEREALLRKAERDRVRRAISSFRRDYYSLAKRLGHIPEDTQ